VLTFHRKHGLDLLVLFSPLKREASGEIKVCRGIVAYRKEVSWKDRDVVFAKANGLFVLTSITILEAWLIQKICWGVWGISNL